MFANVIMEMTVKVLASWLYIPEVPYVFPILIPWLRVMQWQCILSCKFVIVFEPVYNVLTIFGTYAANKTAEEDPLHSLGHG